jgi:Leucine-rich repeat (LRR) protein
MLLKLLLTVQLYIDTINDKEVLPDIENSFISLAEEEDFEELSIDDINSITKSFSKIIESLTYQTKIVDQKNEKPIWWSSLDDVWKKTLFRCAKGNQKTKYIHSHIYTDTSLSEQRRSTMVDHIMRWGIPNWTSDQLTLESILDIDFISLIGREFSDIEPIQYLKKLHTFFISSTNVSDLSPLSNLPKLKYISITDSPVRDLEPIRRLRDIEMILVPEIGIHDIKSFRDKYPLI